MPHGALASLRGRRQPPHDGMRRMGGSICRAPLPLISGRVGGHYELTPPVVPVRTFSAEAEPVISLLYFPASSAAGQAAVGTAALALFQRNSLPSTHIRCRTTARRLATATMARRIPRRWATRTPHAFSHDHFLLWVSSECAAS